jgi:Bacterial Ig-like domain (group 2)
VSGFATVTVTPPPVAAVTVTVSPTSLAPGQTAQAAATLKDANGNVLTGRTVTWSSSNLAVATISATGLVTALAAGTTTIAATSEGVTGSAAVTVTLPPVATVTVSLGTSTLLVGQTTQATAVLKDASGHVLTGRIITWTSANTGVATVSSTGLVTGVAAGTATITATSEGQSGSASIAVSAPPPPGSWPNEPAAFRTLTDVDWSTLTPGGGWGNTGLSNAAIVDDATAPFSPTKALQITYPIGFGGGTGPTKMFYDSPSGEHPKELYAGIWVKVSNPWQAHTSGINKIMFFFAGSSGSDELYMDMKGGGVPYHLQYTVEFPSVQPTYLLSQNVSNPEFTLGVWHRVELYMKYSTTASSGDGILKSWLDGQLVMTYTNVNYPGTGFNEIQIYPIWGGTGETKTETDYYWIDHTHISRP